MKLGVLFSGGKDSTFAAWLAKKEEYELACLISVISKNKDSYMFHTPSIEKTKAQAKTMNIPIISRQTKGKKEDELDDLKEAVKEAKEKYQIEGVVTGAVESVYQSSRIQKICNELDLECFNPLWQKNQVELLKNLIKNKFSVILTGIFAFPLDEKWLGRQIDERFIEEIWELHEKYKINSAGEGGEFETFVLDCPLFKKPLKVIGQKISGENHSWRMEVEVE